MYYLFLHNYGASSFIIVQGNAILFNNSYIPNSEIKVLLLLRRLGAVPSPRRYGLVNLGYVMEQVEMGPFFSAFFGFRLSILFYRDSPYSYITCWMNNRPVCVCSSETSSRCLQWKPCRLLCVDHFVADTWLTPPKVLKLLQWSSFTQEVQNIVQLVDICDDNCRKAN
jgi:hypothetical protein